MTSAGALDGKVAVVTSSSKGIGRALATGLGQAGANVVVNYKNDRAGAEQTCRRIQEAGGIAVAVGADVGVPEDAQRLIDTAHCELGSIDVLVNNVAHVRLGPAQATTLEDWGDAISTNLRGAFLTTITAVAAMGERGGSIINISTCADTLMLRYHAVYTASKGSLEAMTRHLALRLAPRVRVNAIAPTATRMERNWQDNPDFDRSWSAVIPLGRMATPEDYIGPLVFLASDASSFVTGEILHVDGGWTLQGPAPDMRHYDFETDRHRGRGGPDRS
ncbi:dehydrogenase of unknown specificity, short-chain alcohol dehydrogenase [Frankia casuarinae]|jgi:3-oxoacyl-[acyl-carrier protein] reductase|uniref:Short-chain dehydrogenase/reductase SDR n=2 Tax=Frankia casuarinae (strain DSM 45818 / CECT 9043 / HFP020203 / CcI3) TaxID=106370 RepID=Q2JB09_FRACC|nr:MULTISPECIES: SDR family oxidoreductase [Frankia]ABD11533.1 short-chain dehydrogenase/reductase SDR [Frankia casuarinae]ETA00093.1 dehydrogenase of unknown specificity [Frankia sp. CcI6]EYT90164.1 dehydrogenase of unknown specificity, short-chain alcohol dehydrogenase [Frankia casuarinae]KDA40744.1 dehydrogenase of unknown specificity, short-chain alcohol dehydrogenase like [Frankia sp. BMG5.23]KFB02834.1 dehydrogenase of unknown specificity, short-chain alcohol dehydrogenase like [Frankia 